MPREYSRNQRLGSELLRTLSQLLRTDVKDPRLEGVSLTAVELSRDLGIARVYFSLFDPERDIEPVAEGLASAAGFLRGKLGRAMKVRHVPELRFVRDDSAERSAHISRLIDTAVGNGSAPDDEQA